MSTFYKLIFIAAGLLQCHCGYTEFCDADSTDCRQAELDENLWGKLFVAAIDFGTTFSGWAYLYKEDYKNDPTAAICKQWSCEGYSSLKAPTTVLIEPDGETFLAFGCDAETKYAKLAATNKHHNYYYFKRFKMLLDGSQAITRTTTIQDDQGHVLPAITVFALVIQYLKADLQKYWLDHGLKVDDSEIRWVLTVPAIWDDKAKQFMREAANQGGIKNKDLLIALEPEAASLYSRLEPVEKMEDEHGSFIASLKPGAKYMIIDAGGGTMDITVHEVLHKGRLKELHKADGGPWGGTKVDRSFSKMLESIIGVEEFQEFRKVCAYEYLELFRDFEMKKREITPDNDDEMIIRYSQCLAKVVHEVTGRTLYDKISSSPFKEHLELTLDHVLISADIARGFFQEALDNIIEKVANLLKDPKLAGLDSILLVGGLLNRKCFKTQSGLIFLRFLFQSMLA